MTTWWSTCGARVGTETLGSQAGAGTLCPMSCALCNAPRSCPLPPCPVPHVLCHAHGHVPCPVSHVLCPILHVPCSMSHVPRNPSRRAPAMPRAPHQAQVWHPGPGNWEPGLYTGTGDGSHLGQCLASWHSSWTRGGDQDNGHGGWNWGWTPNQDQDKAPGLVWRYWEVLRLLGVLGATGGVLGVLRAPQTLMRGAPRRH